MKAARLVQGGNALEAHAQKAPNAEKKPSASVTARSVLVVSADAGFRHRISEVLGSQRWRVWEAAGGAEAMAQLDAHAASVLLLDNWLPDLEVDEFAAQLGKMYPAVDVLRVDGECVTGTREGTANRHRGELLYALRQAQESDVRSVSARATDTAAWNAAPVTVPEVVVRMRDADAAAENEEWIGGQAELFTPMDVMDATTVEASALDAVIELSQKNAAGCVASVAAVAVQQRAASHMQEMGALPIAGMIGESEAMREMVRNIRAVADRRTTVLLQGPTGSGKEVVAKALHSLSSRKNRAFTVLNCAAIPEALLEAELFGHSRGAFTGAVTSRTGRIEAAHMGTLFLDEIGEMPAALQAKLLRFLENGELQRVGENENVRVDVRVIAATHQPLEEHIASGRFRADLFHRIAVFPVWVPALTERMEDVPLLAEYFLERLGEETPRKRLSVGAMQKLQRYSWPGNVRELGHVLERAVILAGQRPEIGEEDVRFALKG